MSTLNRLIKLFSKTDNSLAKTPLEDFSTEILVGIFEENQDMLDSFVNKVLNIEGDNFKITSQKYFIHDESANCRIDIVIQNQETICFIENKVNSKEGWEQLKRYADILDNYKNLNKHLIYCTKHYDKKEFNRHNFRQIRWSDITKYLLQESNENELVKDAITFFENEGMGVQNMFKTIDLIVMENIQSTINKIYEINELAKTLLTETFENITISSSDFGNQIKWQNRCALIIGNVFGEGYSEIGMGLHFSKAPHLILWLWVQDSKKDRNSKMNEFLEAVNKSSFENKPNQYVWLKKELSDFLSKSDTEEMKREIKEWYQNSLKILCEFINSTPQLVWKIKIK